MGRVATVTWVLVGVVRKDWDGRKSSRGADSSRTRRGMGEMKGGTDADDDVGGAHPAS